MEHGYCIDIYMENEPAWISHSMLVCKEHPSYGIYWQVKGVTAHRKNKIIRKLKRKKIRFRVYEKRWERSSNYRKMFFEHNQAPYRCRYCNKKIARNSMEIDHIIPVAKAKSSANARMLLYIQGISEVNDIRNLAPSCKKCNSKKSDKIGLWWIKGMLGKHKTYWILRKLILLCVFIFLLLYLCQLFLK